MRKFSLTLCLGSALLVAGCGAGSESSSQNAGLSSQGESTSTHSAVTEPTDESTLASHVDLAVAYQSIEQLYAASPIVVRGVIKGDTQPVEFNGAVYTRATVNVTKQYKGATDKEITVLWPGGTTTQAYMMQSSGRNPKITEADRSKKLTILTDGLPLPEKGGQHFLFLGPGEIGVVPGTYYVPMGAYQGIFALKNGAFARHIPQGNPLAPLATSSDQLDQRLASLSGS